jgi:hypothetical protein
MVVLPLYIINKIMLYNSHPVADAFMKVKKNKRRKPKWKCLPVINKYVFNRWESWEERSGCAIETKVIRNYLTNHFQGEYVNCRYINSIKRHLVDRFGAIYLHVNRKIIDELVNKERL